MSQRNWASGNCDPDGDIVDYFVSVTIKSLHALAIIHDTVELN